MWKLCLALAAALALTGVGLPAKADQPMRFRLLPLESWSGCVGQCPSAIAADGEIIDSTPERFLSFVDNNLQGTVSRVVILNSPGGKVVASMALGQVFRKLGFAAIVGSLEQTSAGAGVLVPGR